MVKINKTNASVDLRKMEYLFLLGMQTSETNMEISVEISKKKKKPRNNLVYSSLGNTVSSIFSIT